MNDYIDMEPDNKSHSLVSMQEKPELFNEIMLDLRIEIGSAKIKIADLLNLAEGTVIQLDQKSTDPLVIFVNDKAIAKGQIISANGKYNIRIL